MTEFGGKWTREKLGILRAYLDAYTTVLKNQPFNLMYIDAFAGTGTIAIRDEDKDAKSFIDGSAIEASKVVDKPFDELVFVEKNMARYLELKERMSAFNNSKIQIINEDANDFLQRLDRDWTRHRGVLFLDPFAMEVEWKTIEKIASYKALDMWILFPVMAVSRLLTITRVPESSNSRILTRVYGDFSWRELYRPSAQGELLEPRRCERDRGVEKLTRIYKDKLRTLFGARFMDDSATLRASNNAVLFEFIFCVGNPSMKAIRPAKRIARHLVSFS